ncbi:putative SnoaL-like aldol condensation-catalyzing enzyme [Altererythrobacter atlanticus]|uniref:Uncharacterized protein n=1 Tax=Croceibacterium atlanticum TaxID=1267766 RepID=A0A0F7KRP0_9SPHN|nr:nuclear transport factor 2 family protein [Croceibacterium atlanticum]AKH42274.1 hypothetical protein WYH_01229 [Croceibacterium atlanticum]MBB5731050.1 putative SnoaL-like aldol condensation-catalyzing enzyme [Croceibacterium atlanticum]
MRLSLKLLAAASVLATLSTPAAAQMRALSDPVEAHPDPESLFTSSDPELHRNKQATLHIMRELLQCDQWGRAGEWLTDRYIQHNPLAASGLEGVQRYFIEIAGRKPKENCEKLTNPIVAVQAEDDFVTVLTKREVPYADDPTKSYTTTWFDTWRFVDGKADEHWDPATLPTGTPPQAMDVDAVLLEAKESAAIEKLMWDYVRAADTLNADEYVTVFTEDGSFQATKGRDALHKMISDMKVSMDKRRADGQLSGAMHHVMSNQHIEFLSPTRARVHYYWQTVFGGPAGSETPPRVAAVGNGVDDVVKKDGKWLIMSRNVAPSAEQE